MPYRYFVFKTLMKKTITNLTDSAYRTYRKLILINCSFICRMLMNKFTRYTKGVEKGTEAYLLQWNFEKCQWIKSRRT